MAMTPRRWRRLMRVTSSRGAATSLVPGDLRIRLPQVERYHVVEPIEILSEQAGDGQLDERLPLRVRPCGGREVDPPADPLQLSPVQDGTVAGEQHLLAE